MDKAEFKSYETAQIYRRALAGSNLGIILQNESGKISFIDPKAFSILDLKKRFNNPTEVIGSKLSDILKIIDGGQGYLDELINQKKTKNKRIRISTFAGKTKYLDFRSFPTTRLSEKRAKQIVIEDISQRVYSKRSLTLLGEIGLNLSKTNDLTNAFEIIADKLIGLDEIDAVGIYLIDIKRGVVELAKAKGLSKRFIKRTSGYPLDSKHAGIILNGKNTYFDYRTTFSKLDKTKREGLSTLGVIPFRHDGKVIGCINIGTKMDDGFSDFSKALVESTAIHIGEAIGRIQLTLTVRESQMKYSGLFKNMMSAVNICQIHKDKKGVPIDFTYLDVNKAYEKLIGLKKEDIVGKRVSKIVPEQYKVWMDKYIIAEKTNKPIQFKRMNQLIKTILDITLFKTAPDTYISIYRNVTREKLAEEKLAASEKRYRTLSEMSMNSIFTISKEGLITFVNEQGANQFNKKPAEIIGRNISQLFPNKEAKRRIESIKEVLNSGKPLRFQDIISFPDGNLWLDTWLIPIEGKGGLKESVLGISLDITESKKLQEKLSAITETFISFGLDPEKNIKLLLKTLGEKLGCDCVLYNRPSGKMLQTVNGWNVPQGLKKQDTGRGQVCYELLRGGDSSHIHIKDIHKTKYWKTDKNLKRSSINTFFGKPVNLSGDNIGMVCALFTKRREVDKADIQMINLIASSISVEERRYLAEKKLKGSEERYRTTIDSLSSAIHLMDNDYKILMINKALIRWNKRFKIKADIVGMTVFEAYPFLGVTSRKEYEYVFKTGKPLITEESNIIDGKLIYTETRKTPLISDGKVANILTVITNITKAKKERLKLIESERKYRLLTDNIPVGVFIHTDGIINYIGKEGMKILGYKSEKALLGKNVLEFIHPEDHKIILDIATMREKGEKVPKQYEARLININGKLIDVVISAMIIDYEGQKAIQGVFIDITERKRTERELRAIKTHLETILDGISESLVVIDKDYKIISHNRAFTNWTKSPPNDIRGMKCFQIIHKKNKPCKVCPVREVFKSGNPSESIHYHNNKDGRTYHETKAYPIKAGDKNQAIYIFHDVTDRERMKDKLKQQLNLLLSANTELLKLDTMKTEFMAIASHELRTPLAIIKGYVELMIHEDLGPITEIQKEKLQRIRNNSEYLSNLVGNILDLAKIDSGELKLYKARFKIKSVFSSLHEDMIQIAAKEGVDIILEEEDDFYVNADKERIKQVLMNLLDNAIKFTPKGKSVKFNYKKTDKNVFITVEDNGIGMPKKEIENVFKRFYQIDSSQQRKFKGAGLGLAICKRIIDLHKGEISIKSKIGKGTTMIIRLPL